jgi:hydroxyacylglutathione hydrolase
MLFERIIIGPLGVNCYLIGSSTTRESLIIDPGDEPDKIIDAVQKSNAKPIAILCTHAHIDHAGAAAAIQKAYSIPFYLHPADFPLLGAMEMQSMQLDLFYSGMPEASRHLSDGETLLAGEASFTILHTPGHSPGSICIHSDGFVITGDTLFAGSIGRCDLPGGDQRLIMKSIRSKLMVLDDAERVCPGHGPLSSIGVERRRNPFLIGRDA